MEKKESPQQDNTLDLLKAQENAPQKSGLSSRFSAIAGKLFAVIKFFLGLSLLPFVYAFSAEFLNQLGRLEKNLQNSFWFGLAAFLIVYLFVWEPAKVYAKGQKLLEVVFNFFKPLVKVAPYLLPVYTIILFMLYALASAVLKSVNLISYFIFLFGFSISLHLVFSAKSLRSKQGDFLKANYIFGFSFLYILNLSLLAFFLNIIFKDYSLVAFINNSFQSGGSIFYAIFKQLFL